MACLTVLIRGVETAAGKSWHFQADGTEDGGWGNRGVLLPTGCHGALRGTRGHAHPAASSPGWRVGFPESPCPPPTPGGSVQFWGLDAVATVNFPSGKTGPCCPATAALGSPAQTDGWTDGLAEAQAEMLGREGASWGMHQPRPLLTPHHQAQSQHPLTHWQSWGTHGTWVTRLPWRTLQRKRGIMDQHPPLNISDSPPYLGQKE